ncbi:recombinase family protein [Wukongibacter sp. M2B1]|uniref:recombinase family protein n=1 Tax=Wukongibacter sp. M2B1 TaxID=3088895 RepID=UPI003D7BE217
MKAAIYSRKSKFTGKGESTQNQVEMCKEYAKKHFNIDNEYIIYEDEGFSGGNADRPEFQRMIDHAKKKRFDILICYRLDRISRNISDFTSLIELLQDSNIGFVSIREQFDTSTPMGRAMMYIASVFAQLERETAAERIRDNMLQLARSGRWLGGNCPTGYESEPIIYMDNNLKQKKMFKLSPIGDELELVKLIYGKYLELQSLSQLESYCMQNEIKSKKDKYFHKYSLRNILTNPVYAVADSYVYDYFSTNEAQICNPRNEFTGNKGIMAYNKNSVKKGKSVKTRDISEWIVAIGKHKGIISGKDWVKIQNLINKNKALAPRQGTSYAALLSGFLRCAKCDSFMKVKYGQIKKGTGKRHFYYVCNTKGVSKQKLCNVNNLKGEKADNEVIESLKNLIGSGVVKNLDKAKDDIKIKEMENKKLYAKIEENKKAIDNLLKKLSLTDNESVSRYIMDEIEKLDSRNKDLELKLSDESEVTEMESFNIDLLKESIINFAKTVDSSTTTEKRNMLKSIIDKIEWDGEELNINLLEIKPS